MGKYLVAKIRKDEEGQTLVEYALIIALIAILLIVSLQGVQGGIAAAFAQIVAILTPPGTCC